MITRDRQVRDATDLYALVSQYVPLKRRGNVAVGRCPFHDDKTPSFRVRLTGKHAGTWRCWSSCSEGGDCIDFVAKIENISPWEALKRLAAEAGIPMAAPTESPEQRRRRREEKEIALWWYRRKWAELRSELNRIMRNGPPELHSRDDVRAEYLGQVMRWIERERGTERGMAVFRKAPVIDGAYRRWVAEEKRWERLWDWQNDDHRRNP